MHDPELLTRDRFAENENTSFEVVLDSEQTVPIKLVEVSELKNSTRTERFSILFEGPLERFLPQQLYTLQHPQMGTFELFIVPVFREETCFVYEALFNRLIERQQGF